MNKLTVSMSPHVHSGDSISKNMYGVLIALIPALVCSFIFFGLGAILVTLVSVSSCVFFEWSINRYMLKRTDTSVLDGSAILTGVLLAFNLPSNLPLWMVVVGALFAIGVVKMTFGGLGCNLFNPALAGRAFLLISFPVEMTTWPKPMMGFFTLDYSADGMTGATPLALIKQIIKGGEQATKAASDLANTDALSMLTGNTGGSMGEVCEIALLVGFVYLLYKKIITWHIPISILATVFVFAGALHLLNPSYPSPILDLLSGGLMLGAIFMATDYVTSPMSKKGQLVYGVAIGFLTVVIRSWGAYPEGMSFAILIMNAFVPLINNYFKPKRFGEVVKK